MNSKIYNGNVQPNPKEFKIWVNDEGTIKTWNGTEWIEATAGSDSGSGSSDGVKYFMLVDYNYAELFQFEEGMTFGDWCNSKYNQYGFIYEEGGWLSFRNVHNSMFTAAYMNQPGGQIRGSVYDENIQDVLDLEIDDTTPITSKASYYFSFPK